MEDDQNKLTRIENQKRSMAMYMVSPEDVNIGNQELFELALEESREKISKTNEIFRFIEYRDFDLTEGL